MAKKIRLTSFTILGMLFINGCSEAVDSAAQTGYDKTQGRVDKAREEISKAEELAKKNFDNAEKAILPPSEPVKE